MRRDNEGFTLIELVLTVSLVIILGAIVIPVQQSVVDLGMKMRAESEAAAYFGEMQDAYHADEITEHEDYIPQPGNGSESETINGYTPEDNIRLIPWVTTRQVVNGPCEDDPEKCGKAVTFFDESCVFGVWTEDPSVNGYHGKGCEDALARMAEQNPENAGSEKKLIQVFYETTLEDRTPPGW